MMLCVAGIVLVVVYAHDQRDVLALRGRGDNHLFCAGGQMPLCLIGLSEEPCGLDDNLDLRAPSRAIPRSSLRQRP